MNFTYEAYVTMLNNLKDNGYHVADYHNYKSHEKVVILRHDVDMSLEKAVEMAYLEKKYGVKSTYYILISSEFYNIYSKRAIMCIKEIMKCGHSIGLHFDEERYNHSDNLIKCMEKELSILELCIGEQVKSISMHRPSSKTLESDYVIKGGTVVNSYSKEFFSDFKYVSDSRKHWREDAISIIESNEYKRLHILTHPIWYEKETKDMREQLKRFCKQAEKERYDALRDNIRDLEKIFIYEEV